MDEQEIREVLEAYATIREDQTKIHARRSASLHDVEIARRSMLRFLDDLDADLTVGEIREALSGRFV